MNEPVGYGRSALFEGRTVHSIRWIYSVIPPQYRFVRVDQGAGGWLLVSPDGVVSYWLQKEYERQLRAELIDPEWPSEHWEKDEEFRCP